VVFRYRPEVAGAASELRSPERAMRPKVATFLIADGAYSMPVHLVLPEWSDSTRHVPAMVAIIIAFHQSLAPRHPQVRIEALGKCGIGVAHHGVANFSGIGLAKDPSAQAFGKPHLDESVCFLDYFKGLGVSENTFCGFEAVHEGTEIVS